MKNEMSVKAFFKTPKIILNKLRSKKYLRLNQQFLFIDLIHRLDQHPAGLFAAKVKFEHSNFTFIRTPSQFSKIKKDLVERRILILHQRETRYGQHNQIVKKSKRYNMVSINMNLNEWIPIDKRQHNARYAIMPSSLKARVSQYEVEANPILQDIKQKAHIHPIGHILNLSQRVREVYAPMYGLRYLIELLENNPSIFQSMLKTNNEEVINTIFYRLLKNNATQANRIGQQRTITRQRHTTIYGDYLNMEKSYINSVLGLDTHDPYLSVLYSHKNRINNMDRDFFYIDRIRRLSRLALLEQGLTFKYGEKPYHYDHSIVEGVPHNSLNYQDNDTLNIQDQHIRGYNIKQGTYPKAHWQFTKDFKYPKLRASAPVQVDEYTGKVFKTYSSDHADNIIHQAKKHHHTVSVDPIKQQELRDMDNFDQAYIRPHNPDYRFTPIFDEEITNGEDFFLNFFLNINRLFDLNLISEDDFEIGVQMLIEQTSKAYPNEKVQFDLLIQQHTKGIYSQTALLLSTITMDRLTRDTLNKVYEIKPHNTAFNLFEGMSFIENHFVKRIGEKMGSPLSFDRTTYVDPFVTYINVKENRIEYTERVDREYMAYLMDVSNQCETDIEQVYAYQNKGDAITLEDLERLSAEIPIDYSPPD